MRIKGRPHQSLPPAAPLKAPLDIASLRNPHFGARYAYGHRHLSLACTIGEESIEFLVPSNADSVLANIRPRRGPPYTIKLTTDEAKLLQSSVSTHLRRSNPPAVLRRYWSQFSRSQFVQIDGGATRVETSHIVGRTLLLWTETGISLCIPRRVWSVDGQVRIEVSVRSGNKYIQIQVDIAQLQEPLWGRPSESMRQISQRMDTANAAVWRRDGYPLITASSIDTLGRRSSELNCFGAATGQWAWDWPGHTEKLVTERLNELGFIEEHLLNGQSSANIDLQASEDIDRVVLYALRPGDAGHQEYASKLIRDRQFFDATAPIVTHAIGQRPDGIWISKMGVDVMLGLSRSGLLEGNAYGRPFKSYVRLRPSAAY